MNSFKDIKAVIFDIDGTLMDSVGRIVQCMQYSFHKGGYAEPDDYACRQVIGLSLVEAVADLATDLSETEVLRLVDYYRECYTRMEDEHPTSLFDDAIPVLQNLYKHGYIIGVATGKSRKGCRRILNSTGLGNIVQISVAGDEFRSNPDPEMILAVADRLMLPVKSCLMVGDSTLDIGMAEKLHMPGVGVLTGVHDRSTLETCHPLAIVSGLTELESRMLNL